MTRPSRRFALLVCSATILLSPSGAGSAGRESAPDSVSTHCQTLFVAGRHAEIETYCRAGLVSGPLDSLEIGTLDMWLAYSLSYQGKGKDPECLSLAAAALAIRERGLGPDDPLVAEALMCLAEIHTRLADYDGVDAMYNRALAIRETAFGPRHPKVARALANYAIFLKNTGRLDRARDSYERSLSIELEALGPDDPSVARTWYNIGNLAIQANDPRGAERAFREAIAVRERSPGTGRNDLARFRLGLASALVRRHEVIDAREQAEGALRIYEADLGPDNPQVIEAVSILGSILREIGDTEQAEALMGRVLRAWERNLGPEHPRVAQVVSELAQMRRQKGDLDGAIAMSRRVLAIREKALGPDHLATVFALSELAQLSLDRGEIAAADSLAERSVAGQSAILGPDSLASASALLTLAECRRRTGRVGDAAAFLDRASVVLRRMVGERHPTYDAYLRSRCRLLADAGRFDESLALSIESMKLQRDLIRSIAQGLPERQAMRYLAEVEPAQDLALTLLADHGELEGSAGDVWSQLVQSRALVLDEMARRMRVIGGTSDADSTTRRERREHSDLTRELAWMLVSGPDPASTSPAREKFLVVRERQESLERRLARSRDATIAERDLAGLSPRAIQSVLPPGSAVVSYFRYRHCLPRDPASQSSQNASGSSPIVPEDSCEASSYLAMIVAPDRDVVDLVDLGRGDEIELRISRWRDEAGLGAGIPQRTPALAEQLYRETGNRLRESIWDPIAPRVAGARQVFIVPDGELALVDFATLPVDDDRYLIDRETRFHMATTERDLIPGPGAVPAARGLLAIGAPDFDALPVAPESPSARVRTGDAMVAGSAKASGGRGTLPSCAEFAKVSFHPLPGSGREIDDVVALWSSNLRGRDAGAVRLVGAAASEEAFKELASGCRVLHVASHGFFLEADCGSPSARTRGVGGISPSHPAESRGIPRDNPLLLSGLALARANVRGSSPSNTEDGILTAAEIAGVDLTGTEWAVLSACATGTGATYAGEGVLGLRRGFQIAGAATVIMSLWSVDDEIAREWMGHLYRSRLHEGRSTPEAVHEASHTMLQARRQAGKSTHPFYWAGFIASGDWR